MATAAPPDYSRPAAVDPAAFIVECERITNESDLEAWLGLYAADAEFESITDGARGHYRGIDEIAPAARVLAAVFRERRLRVSKTLVCAADGLVVNTWTGGFDGRDTQRGVELWTLRDGRVVKHQMYTYLDVRPAESAVARMRALITSPRVVWTFLRQRSQARTSR